MLRLFADVIPIDPEEYERRYRQVREVVVDTVDTVVGVGQDFTSNVQSGGGHSLPWILGAIAAALIALGFCIFMVRAWRRRGEQQLSFATTQS